MLLTDNQALKSQFIHRIKSEDSSRDALKTHRPRSITFGKLNQLIWDIIIPGVGYKMV